MSIGTYYGTELQWRAWETNIYILTLSGDSFSPSLFNALLKCTVPSFTFSRSSVIDLSHCLTVADSTASIFFVWVQGTLACYLTLGCLVKWIGLICQNKQKTLYSMPAAEKWSIQDVSFLSFKIQQPLRSCWSLHLFHPSIRLSILSSVSFPALLVKVTGCEHRSREQKCIPPTPICRCSTDKLACT